MLILRGLMSLCVLLWLGCPVSPPEQPPTTGTGPMAGGGPGGAGGGAVNPAPPGDQGAPPDGGAPVDGMPLPDGEKPPLDGANPPEGGAPPEGGPDGQPPGDGSPPPEGAGQAPVDLGIEAGEGVLLSGTVTYSGSQKGDLRVDLLKENYQGTPMPRMVTTVSVGSNGAFEVELPKDYGEVNLVAYLDFDGNGISPGEPIAAKNGVSVKKSAISGLNLKLGDDPADMEIRLPPLEGSPPPEGDGGEKPPPQ